MGVPSQTGTSLVTRPARRPAARACPRLSVGRRRSRARQPAEDLDGGEGGPRVPGAQAQPAVVGLGDGDAAPRGHVGRVEVSQFGPQHPAVEWHRLDAAALGQPAGSLGIVVGVTRHPGEVDRCAGAHEGEHGRTVLQQRPLPLPVTVARHVRQVGAGLLGSIPDAGLAQHLVAGNPEPAAGARGGAAEPVRLLDHHHPQAMVRRGERGGHPGGAAAHHHNVEPGAVRSHGTSRALILEHVTVSAEGRESVPAQGGDRACPGRESLAAESRNRRPLGVGIGAC